MAAGWAKAVGSVLGQAARAGAASALRELTKRSGSPRQPPRTSSRAPRPPAREAAPRRRATGTTRKDAYTGDHAGAVPSLEYAPRDDGRPDPGEVVWAWVPYEEGDGRGKDRPVLLIGRDGRQLLGLMLTSKDHDRDAEQEARWGRHWLDIGTGDWDSGRRPSEVRLDRVLRIEEDGVRREGAVLDRARFDEVAAAVRRLRR